MCRAECESCADAGLQLSSPRSHRQFLSWPWCMPVYRLPTQKLALGALLCSEALLHRHDGVLAHMVELPFTLNYMVGLSGVASSPRVSCLPCINSQVKGQTSLGVRPNLLLTQAADVFMVCIIGRKFIYFHLFSL